MRDVGSKCQFTKLPPWQIKTMYTITLFILLICKRNVSFQCEGSTAFQSLSFFLYCLLKMADSFNYFSHMEHQNALFRTPSFPSVNKYCRRKKLKARNVHKLPNNTYHCTNKIHKTRTSLSLSSGLAYCAQSTGKIQNK